MGRLSIVRDTDPPLANCALCTAPDFGQMVECDGCTRWHHFGCVGLQSHVNGAPWSCNACLALRDTAENETAANIASTAASFDTQTSTSTVFTTPLSSAGAIPKSTRAPMSPRSLQLRNDMLEERHSKWMEYMEHQQAREVEVMEQLAALQARMNLMSANNLNVFQPKVTSAMTSLLDSIRRTGQVDTQSLYSVAGGGRKSLFGTVEDSPMNQLNPKASTYRPIRSSAYSFTSDGLGGLFPSSRAQPPPSSIASQNISATSQGLPVQPFASAQVNGAPAMNDIEANYDRPLSQMALSVTRRSIGDLPKFSGDRSEWAYFEATYYNTAERGQYTNIELVERLRKSLTGRAEERVRPLIMYNSPAESIMASLKRIYGSREWLVCDLTKELQTLVPEKMKSLTDPNLVKLSGLLNMFVASMSSQGYQAELTNSFLVKSIIDKLPELYELDWRNRRGPEDTGNLVLLAEFLDAKVENFPPESYEKSAKPRARQSTDPAPRRVLAHQQPATQPEKKISCFKCKKQGHAIFYCDEFKGLNISDRYKAIKELNLCSCCLTSSSHIWSDCPRKRKCGVDGCEKFHNRLLHPVKPRSVAISSESSLPKPQSHDSPPGQSAGSSSGASLQLSHNTNVNGTVLFKVVPIEVFDAKGRKLSTFALLDGASAVTLMDRQLFDTLGLSGTRETLELQWTGGVTKDVPAWKTSFEISIPKSKRRRRFTNVFATDGALDLPEQTVDAIELKKRYPHLRGIPIPSMERAKPLIMIGLLHAPSLAGLRSITGGPDDPVASKTELGWIVFGPTSPSINVVSLSHRSYNGHHQTLSQLCRCDEELHHLVKGHFSTENFGVMAPRQDLVSEEVQRATAIMQQTLKFTGGRYEIGLLWRTDNVKLPPSYDMALKRLESLEKALARNPEMMQWMGEHMRDLILKGYARKASAQELAEDWDRVWHCPLFIVVNKNKFPPKPRVVADVAAKVSNQSLNTHLLKGPDNLVPLAAGLFKFRESEHATNADVREMFPQVGITPADQQCQRVLWRDCDTSRKPDILIIQRMMFGPTCSPTCAQYVKNVHCEQFRDAHPEAVAGLTERTYVDDYFNSHKSVEEAVQVSKSAIEICASMGMQLVGFQSNTPEVLQELPQEAVKPALVSLSKGDFENYVTKVLGMYWESCADVFTYKLAREELLVKMMSTNYVPTKREVLRTIMRIFDPLGLISHYLIRGRIVLQNIWREGTDWDEPISEVSHQQWQQFVKQLPNIERIRIPRRYATIEPSECRVSLITFVDASEQAFSATSYFRFAQGDVVQVGQVMAKAKVAPTKKLTIPQLELQSALIGVRLAETIRKLHPFEINEIQFLSDSAVVLLWICSRDYNFKTFVAARVGEILEFTTQAQWFKVGTKLNVADDATKWTDPTMGDVNTRWFRGPDFLRQPREEWPVTPATSLRNSEKSVAATVLMTRPAKAVRQPPLDFVDDISPRFRSNWPSLVRVTAFVLRSVTIAKKSQRSRETFITPVEYEAAEHFIFRKIQREAFVTEMDLLVHDKTAIGSTSLAQFTPFLDNGLIRMGSRAQKARLSYAARNPAILPNQHPLVDLLVYHIHDKNMHMGEDDTIAELLRKVWVLNARSAVRRIKRSCQLCKIRRAHPRMPLMGELPVARLDFAEKPFTHVGLDVFGPYNVKQGRSTIKRYGLIFTCMSFRAVHLELLEDISTETCIMAIRNFLARRGWSKHFYSDNGKNFVGANNLIQRDLTSLKSSLGEEASKKFQIYWHFIPAYSPWMGGAWERLIQAVKKCLNHVMTEETPSESVLRNALVEAEFWMNSRPLTHIPIDHEDAEPLTPNAVLFGNDDGQLASSMSLFDDASRFSSKASRRARHLVDKFLHRWTSEYLPSIMRRDKWTETTEPVKIGDIAILTDPSQPKKAWSKCKITEVHPGADGHIRSVDVEMPDKSVKKNRAVGRIAVLQLSPAT